ncbi:MAG: hypothetical protein ABR592_04275 [Nitriliruptorales bacterium]
MTDSEGPATLNVEQAGALLGTSRRSAYRAAAAGNIPTIRFGHRILVPTAMLYQISASPRRMTPTRTAPRTGAGSSRRDVDSQR